MTILLDACVPRRYLRLLKEWGYLAEVSLKHLKPDASDPEIMTLATKLKAALLTVDLDFSNILDYPPAQYNGIIVLRYQPEDEIALDATLKVALDDLYREGLSGALVIVSPNRYRIRR